MISKDFNMSKEELISTAETYMNETFNRYDFIAERSADMFL